MSHSRRTCTRVRVREIYEYCLEETEDFVAALSARNPAWPTSPVIRHNQNGQAHLDWTHCHEARLVVSAACIHTTLLLTGGSGSFRMVRLIRHVTKKCMKFVF